jgi:glutathione S-transferase
LHLADKLHMLDGQDDGETAGASMLRLYDSLISGNGYKARWMLMRLSLPFERVELDIDKGETRTPAFLAMNPNGRVPLLQIAQGDWLAESNAILCYLADGTPYLPTDRRQRAAVMQWLFFEQYSHEPNIATTRHWIAHELLTDERRAQLPGKIQAGYAALDVMERQLTRQKYFVGGRLTVADVALYAYTHVAHEGNFDLGKYPAVRDWIARFAAEPGYFPITAEVGTAVTWSDAQKQAPRP